jgi:hypothetical protein
MSATGTHKKPRKTWHTSKSQDAPFPLSDGIGKAEGLAAGQVSMVKSRFPK